MFLSASAFIALFALFANFVKSRINISYDYAFVSGELRISRVVNINKRKFLCDINPEEILQIGDVEGSDFERLSSDPQTKTIICTPNGNPAEDKFFMYILVKAGSQKQMFVLECREELLNNILKFAKRTVLENGYVRQEVKRAEREKEAERQRLAIAQATQQPEMDEQELAAMRAATASQNTNSNQANRVLMAICLLLRKLLH